jgi:Sec-independent protein translocase protein TatA
MEWVKSLIIGLVVLVTIVFFAPQVRGKITSQLEETIKENRKECGGKHEDPEKNIDKEVTDKINAINAEIINRDAQIARIYSRYGDISGDTWLGKDSKSINTIIGGEVIDITHLLGKITPKFLFHNRKLVYYKITKFSGDEKPVILIICKDSEKWYNDARKAKE